MQHEPHPSHDDARLANLEQRTEMATLALLVLFELRAGPDETKLAALKAEFELVASKVPGYVPPGS